MLERAGVFDIPLSDRDLCNMGKAAFYESKAKALIAMVVKAVTKRDAKRWIKLERWQLKQLIEEIEAAVHDAGDAFDLLVKCIKIKSGTAQNYRHAVIHAIWGAGSDGEAQSYDFGRRVKLSSDDIEMAVRQNRELLGMAHDLAMETALAILDGKIIPHPAESVGPLMFRSDQPVRF